MKLLTVLAIVCLLALAAPAAGHPRARCHSSIGNLSWNGRRVQARYRICWVGRPYANGSERTVTISTPAGPVPLETLRWPL